MAFLHAGGQQKYVAITMDDMPFNTMPGYYTMQDITITNTRLLKEINALQTPVAIFINGKTITGTNDSAARFALLKDWCRSPFTTLGNHTLNHPNCANISFAQFRQEVAVNGSIIRKAAGGKELSWFRFPFNSLGNDSLQQAGMKGYLTATGYQIAPFTIESMDYAFDALYNNALKTGNRDSAENIARQYIRFTLQSFDYFEDMAMALYGRSIPHIFLCHANRLHADHYPDLVKALKERGYKFIDMETAMRDDVYSAPLYYFKKAGVSWLFRWIKDEGVRKDYLRRSPDMEESLYKAYQNLNRQ